MVNPGPPTVNIYTSITQPSFNHLIPTTSPITVVDPPTVQPSDNVTHPTDQPLIPQGTP
jgi:hypothetical protein